MKIFLSYSSKDRTQVEPIYLALLAQRHKVFFDRSNLPKGDEYDSHIRKSIEDSNLFIFMVSLNSLNDGSYTLTELGIAQKTWSHPKGKVLPVLISDTQLMKLPAYLKAVTILESNGNLAAEVADAVYRINKEKRRRLLNYFVGGLVLSMMVGAGIYFFLPDVIVKTSTEINGKDGMLGLQIPASVAAHVDPEGALALVVLKAADRRGVAVGGNSHRDSERGETEGVAGDQLTSLLCVLCVDRRGQAGDEE